MGILRNACSVLNLTCSCGLGHYKQACHALISPPDRSALNALPIGPGEITMIQKQHRILYLILGASLIGLLTGCSYNRTNSQFIVRISGSTNGIQFDGQCTAQKAGFWSRESVAQSLDVKGTVESASQPQDYETSGFFIYCAVANQSTNGTITVELLREGNVVTSGQSSSPDEPAILEFGQRP